PDAGDALVETSWDLSGTGRLVAIGWASINPSDRIHDRSIALIDTASGARRELGRVPGVVHAAPRFGPDDLWLVAQRYLRSADGYAHRSLWRYDLAADAATDLTGTWDRWPAPWAVSRASSTQTAILTTAEDRARTPLFAVDPDTGAATLLGPSDGSWDFVAAVPGQHAVVGVRSSLLAPPDLAHLDLATGVLTPLARLSGFTLDPATVARVRELAVPVAARADGTERTLQAFLVEPVAPADGHTPGNGRTLFWIHGGPVASWSDHWHWRWSSLAMAARGYRVVLPNPSGSTGFGMDWVNDIWGNTWGGRCYDDLMRTVAFLEAEHGLAARDMVAMGGSFGGYMTNWIGGQTDRFRLLVTHASLFDMSAFHGVTDVPAWWELMMGDHPWGGRDFDRYSPHRFVSHWKTPTLVLHGERDFRVPLGEGLALFEALQRHGVPSELAVFPDENHWILKPRNIVAWYETVLDFFDRRWDDAPPSPTS
ncbi:MAG: S9 family peptidase, partial [Deltaproteobacteria bacterium]|nr:S9 family peptidase [Deltaproteobacteria bacterium]